MPEEYVDTLKRKRIIAAANAYIKYRQIEKNPRFDIIGVLIEPRTNNITYSNHIENAFYPEIRTINSSSYSGKWKWKHRNKTIK